MDWKYFHQLKELSLLKARAFNQRIKCTDDQKYYEGSDLD